RRTVTRKQNPQQAVANTPRSSLPTQQQSQKQPQGKSVDSDGTVYTFSKVYPTARQPLAPSDSCRQSSLNRGREFATRCSMAGFVHTWTPRTLILTGKTWRVPMKISSCCIVERPWYPART